MNETGKVETSTLKKCIVNWLAITQDLNVPTGLDQQKVSRLASELFHAIADERVSPEVVEVDEDLKQVLSVLVSQLSDSGGLPESRLKQAAAVYRFIERLSWAEDHLGEKQDLLIECAEVGWGAVGLSLAEVTRQRLADNLLEKRQSETALDFFSKALFEACSFLYERRDAAPADVAEEAAALFAKVRDSRRAVGLFDEKDYLLGELALVAGNATRQLGRRVDADKWLDRAEFRFRHVLNPDSKLGEVGYQRLALKFDQRQYEDVLDLIPSVMSCFEKFEMQRACSRLEFLKAMCLKALGKSREAFALFEGLVRTLDVQADSQLLGQSLVEVGAFHASQSRYDVALQAFNQALVLLKQGTRPIFLTHLKATVGETLVLQGRIASGAEAYREAISDYLSLGLATQAAYLRILLADALIQIGYHVQAEVEILAALPTIEEQRMVSEGFAAFALLKESIRRSKTDPNALRELREHLQKNN